MSCTITGKLEVGGSARIKFTLEDSSGNLIDGSPIPTVQTKTPAGSTSSATVVRDSLGTYHADVLISTSGQWAYKVVSVSPGVADSGFFSVAKSAIP